MIRLSMFILMIVFLCCCQQSERIAATPEVSPVAQAVLHIQEDEWEFSGSTGVRIQTDAWDVYTTIQYDHIIEALPTFYEELIIHYSTIFGDLPLPEQRLDVFLFATESQWRVKVAQMLGSEAQHWFKLGRGGLTIDGTAVLYDLDRRGRSRTTFRIAAHEGWHQYAEAIFKSDLPTWLDEGIGTWMEGFRLRKGSIQFESTNNWDRLNSLRKIVNANRLTPLHDLLQSEPSALLDSGRSSLLEYYGQLWGFINFLYESNDGKHRVALEQMLNDALHGTLKYPRKQRGNWIYYFTDQPEQFEQEYQDWIKQFIRPGSSWRS